MKKVTCMLFALICVLAFPAFCFADETGSDGITTPETFPEENVIEEAPEPEEVGAEEVSEFEEVSDTEEDSDGEGYREDLYKIALSRGRKGYVDISDLRITKEEEDNLAGYLAYSLPEDAEYEIYSDGELLVGIKYNADNEKDEKENVTVSKSNEKGGSSSVTVETADAEITESVDAVQFESGPDTFREEPPQEEPKGYSTDMLFLLTVVAAAVEKVLKLLMV